MGPTVLFAKPAQGLQNIGFESLLGPKGSDREGEKGLSTLSSLAGVLLAMTGSETAAAAESGAGWL